MAPLLAGLASSTGATLHFARMARARLALTALLGAGILLASGTMMPRLLLIVALVNPALLPALLAPAIVMALLIYVPAWWLLRGQAPVGGHDVSDIQNPLELKSALAFGVLLTLVLLLSELGKDLLGDRSLVAIGALSGLSGIDAIALAGARYAAGQTAATLAAWAIVAASSVNCLWKVVLAWSVGGRALALQIGLPLLGAAAAGPLVLWVV